MISLANNPLFQFILHMLDERNKKSISKEIYEEIRVPFFDSRYYVVDLNISKNLLHKLTLCKVKKIYIFCHSVTGDKYEFSRLAKRILNEDLSSGVVSYNRKFRNSNTISTGTISLERRHQTNFSITGCRYLLDEVINYIYNTFKKKIILVGFSAGTSLIATYLGCPFSKNKEKIDYAVLISAGFHYKESMNKMPLIYKILCFLKLYMYFRTFHITYKHNDIISLAFNFATFNVFNYVISQYKYSIFNSEDEYFKHHDPKYYLPNIKHKVYFLNSLDDFCFPRDTILPLIDIYRKKNNFHFHILPSGGHICFKNNSKECGIFEFIKTLSN